jgi:putative transposase
MGRAAGAPARLVARPPSLAAALPDPRSRLEVQRAFDEIFRSQGIEIVRTPIHAPQANAYAERFVGTVRRECLDWILIASRRQLERVLSVYVDHYNGHRPHRGLGLVAPQPRPGLRPVAPPHPLRVRRRDRLGGLIHEYSAAA